MGRDAIRIETLDGRLMLLPERDGGYSVLRGMETLGKVELDNGGRYPIMAGTWLYRTRDGVAGTRRYQTERGAARALAAALQFPGRG